jgi:hypothetical protein
MYAGVPGYRRGMKLIPAAGVLLLMLSVASADSPSNPAFDERDVCLNERGRANGAADQVRAPRSEAWALAGVERARRDLAAATNDRARAQYKRRLDEAVAQLESVRAATIADIAKRDETARQLSECVERERRAFLEEAAARSAEAERKANEQRAQRERIEKLMSSKPTVQLVLSAMVCVAKNDRASALRAIADEKKYARIGGVQDNAKIYELQQAVRESDQRAASLGRELKQRKSTAIKCGDPKVTQLATCITRPIEDGPCLVDDIAGPLQVVQAFELGR